MIVELISIGDEIITGHTVDTDSVFIARRLADIGLSVRYKTAVGDDLKSMEEVFCQALKRADLIIATGGLGPTDDDITKKVIVKVFKRNLVFHENILDDIKGRYARRGIKMPSINQNQALLPQGATYLPNKFGSAVGIVIAEEGKIFVSLPGVPREMEQIVNDELIPFLQAKTRQEHLCVLKLRTTGIIESALAELIVPVVKLPETVHLAYLPSYSGVDLRIISSGATRDVADDNADSIATAIRKVAGKYIYGEGNITLEAVVGDLLKSRGQTLATAESCTAGLLAGQITAVPGSSAYFERGVVVYSNKSKSDLLDVPPDLIDEFGAVSTQVAEAMARGLINKYGVDYGLAVTGIAGPDGGTDEKPVGTTFIAVATREMVHSRRFTFGLDREMNRGRAVYAALEMLRRAILEMA